MAGRVTSKGKPSRRVVQRLASGLLVLVPLVITLSVLGLLFRATVGALASFLGFFLGELPAGTVLLLASLVSVALVYLAGTLASHVVGRRAIAAGERLLAHIPVVKTIYAAASQVIELVKGNPDTVKQTVLLVEFPAPGMKAFGFMTGRITTPDGTECYTVFIPTTPNPTTGFLQIVPVARAEALDISMEEAFRLVMSAGFLAPPSLTAQGTPMDAAHGNPGTAEPCPEGPLAP